MSYSKDHYHNKVFPKIKKDFSISNSMAVPKITKITLNMGLGVANNKKQDIANYIDEFTAITGSKPIVTHCRKAIASFKIREGFPIGIKVTLRRERMYEFLDRLIHVVLPRTRDFRGLPSYSFDKFGNFNFGIKDHTCFPEIDFDKVFKSHGLDIAITTTAKNAEECEALIKAFNIPINNQIKKPKAKPKRYFRK